MRIILFLFTLMIIACRQEKLRIEPLSPYSQTGFVEGKPSDNYMIKFYFIENFGYNNSDNKKEIFDFVETHQDSNLSSYKNYELRFYKRTEKLNETFQDSESNDIAWYEDDVIFIFTWVNGKQLPYMQFRNGKCINCGNEN